MPMQPLSIIPLAGLPEIKEGDNLAELIARTAWEAGMPLHDGDCLVVTQKIVSKSEGRMVALDHGDREAADEGVHPLHVERAGEEDRGLFPVTQHRDSAVDDVEVRVDTHRGGEEGFAVGAVAVEEIAVVEIAVRAGKSDRIGRLVDRIIIRFAQHRKAFRSAHLVARLMERKRLMSKKHHRRVNQY